MTTLRRHVGSGLPPCRRASARRGAFPQSQLWEPHLQEGVDCLDSLLPDWKLVKAAGSRSIADRSRGAVRLWRMQAAALIVQLATLAAAEILRAVHG